MRVPFLRATSSAALVLALIVAAGRSTRISAQQPLPSPAPPRIVALIVPPQIHTKIEAVLATPGAMLSTDYYTIEMRFGPSVRIDAVVVTDVDAKTRTQGLRVQVRDEGASHLEGASFLDIEEISSLSHALESMADLTAKWTGRDDRRATDLSFATLGGLRVDVHQSGRVQKIFLSTGAADPITTSFDVSDIHTLKQAFDQGLALLNSK
jgi:hypothetical protein